MSLLLVRQQASSCCAPSSRRPARGELQAPPTRHRDVSARAGFASNSTKKADDAPPRLRRAAGELGADKDAVNAARKERRVTKAAETAASKAGTPPKGFPDGWSQLDAPLDELLPAGKATKAVALRTGRVLVLYRVGDIVYCSDVESPAYKYPMHDARVFRADAEGKEVPEGGGEFPAAECPLDGCVFDLRTGAPLVWCPGGGLVRGMLGALKQKTEASPLLVHPVFIDASKRVWVKVRAAK